jgi:serine protease inhibitor
MQRATFALRRRESIRQIECQCSLTAILSHTLTMLPDAFLSFSLQHFAVFYIIILNTTYICIHNFNLIMNRFILSMAIAATLLTCTMCGSTKPDSGDDARTKVNLKDLVPISLTDNQKQIITANDAFACNLYNAVSASSDGKSFFISPLSFSSILTLDLGGAQGDTKSQIIETLGYRNFNAEDLYSFYEYLLPKMMDVDNSTTFIPAFSIWTNKYITPKTDFVNFARNNFSSEILSRDFGSSSTLKEINNWCSDKTNGKISNALSELDANTAALFINALYFKGTWANEFSEASTSKGKFTSYDGTVADVDMMHASMETVAAKVGSFTALEMPYGNEAYSMIVMLPDQGTTPDKAFSSLSSEQWLSIANPSRSNGYESWKRYECNVSMPKFKLEYSNDAFVGILEGMGIKDAFDKDKASFPDICNYPLYISKIVHKTYLDVDEHGSEAAAITIEEFNVTSIGPSEDRLDFTVDRPFIVMIRENTTGTVLFLGRVNSI